MKIVVRMLCGFFITLAVAGGLVTVEQIGRTISAHLHTSTR